MINPRGSTFRRSGRDPVRAAIGCLEAHVGLRVSAVRSTLILGL